jgi:hypothetical protein
MRDPLGQGFHRLLVADQRAELARQTLQQRVTRPRLRHGAVDTADGLPVFALGHAPAHVMGQDAEAIAAAHERHVARHDLGHERQDIGLDPRLDRGFLFRRIGHAARARRPRSRPRNPPATGPANASGRAGCASSAPRLSPPRDRKALNSSSAASSSGRSCRTRKGSRRRLRHLAKSFSISALGRPIQAPLDHLPVQDDPAPGAEKRLRHAAGLGLQPARPRPAPAPRSPHKAPPPRPAPHGRIDIGEIDEAFLSVQRHEAHGTVRDAPPPRFRSR